MKKVSKRIILLILLGLLSYAVFLLANFPAAKAHAWFGAQLPAQAYGLSGTIWDGQAAVVQHQQQRLERLDWNLIASRLLLGSLSAEIKAQLPDGRVQGRVHLTGDRLEAEDLRFDIAAGGLRDWAGLKIPVRIDGRFDVLMRKLALRGRDLLTADGMISWHQAQVYLGAPLALGNLNLRLEPAEEGIRGTLMSQGSPLKTAGDLRIAPNGRFEMDLSVRAEGEVDEATLRAMRVLGIPTDGSAVQARLTGGLDGTGLRLQPAG